ncbi:MAG: EFR1 family ferrodoxin, partial [Candidatus Helarchaeota archaeon]
MPLVSAIFYFSQQGSTKRIAEMIGAGLTEGDNRCTLFRLTKLHKDLELISQINFKRFALIGFGTPVYYFYPPNHLFEIFKALPKLDHAKGFLFCTSGGNPGATLFKIKQALQHTGLKIIDGYDRWRGLDQHRCYSNFPQSALPTSIGHPTDQELAEAKQWGQDLIAKALAPSTPEKTDFWSKDNSWAQGGWIGRDAPFMEHWFPEFHLNEEKCTQCGECAARCPVDAIVLNPFPRWVNDCDRCYLCDLYCPAQAIQCDWTKQIAF